MVIVVSDIDISLAVNIDVERPLKLGFQRIPLERIGLQKKQ